MHGALAELRSADEAHRDHIAATVSKLFLRSAAR